jgi:hypothetical protein
MKISDFVSSLSSGVARTNRFSVMLAMPTIVTGDATPGRTELKNLLLFCDQAQLPGLTVNTTPIRIFGEVRETPTEYNYEPITLSFYVDRQMHLKAWFDDWIKMIQNGGQRTFRYYDEYICPQMQIFVQDTKDNTTYQVSLYEVWPKSIGSIQMDYASKDVMKLSVTLQYKYWRYITVDDTRNNIPFQSELSKLTGIPEEYFSKFNSFQNDLSGAITSNLNSTKLLGYLQGSDSGVSVDQTLSDGESIV